MDTPKNPEVVVITGASAGVGRATAQAFARRGADLGLLARGREGLDAARRDVEALGGRAIAVPTDVADPDQVEARRRGRRKGVRAHRRLGQQRDGLGLLARQADEGRGVSPGHRGHVPRHRPRHARGPEADAAPRPRLDRPGRVGTGLPGHPAPVGVLRGQARDPGLLRLPPLRVDPRREPSPADDGADAAARIPLSSDGSRADCRGRRSRSRRSSSPRSPPRRSSGPLRTTAVR